MRRYLILTGGSVDFPSASVFMKKNCYTTVIAVDGGMNAAKKLDIIPDYCVGDFDSVDPDVYRYFQSIKGIHWEQHLPEKDETDTELAIRLALETGAEEIHIFGATGTRLDHTFANMGLLEIPMRKKIPCWLVDGHNRITMINSDITVRKEDSFGKYLSLLPYSDKVTGVTLKGLKYPLENYTFVKGNSLGVSNEITAEQAEIRIKSGELLLIMSKD